jgi:hypothetical protein
LRERKRRLEIRQEEESDREGYLRHPQPKNKSLRWETPAAWLAIGVCPTPGVI